MGCALGITSEAPKRAIEHVLGKGEQDGFEHMVLVDSISGNSHAGSVHQKSEISFTPDLKKTMSEANRKITLYHNHPRMRPLSPDDVLALTYIGMDSIVAVGSNGSVYAAKMTKELKDWQSQQKGVRRLRRMLDNVSEAVRLAIQVRVNEKKLTADDAQRIH